LNTLKRFISDLALCVESVQIHVITLYCEVNAYESELYTGYNFPYTARLEANVNCVIIVWLCFI